MGESPVLHASGFHHPALARVVLPVPDSPVNAFDISEVILTYSLKICKGNLQKIRMLDGEVNECYPSFKLKTRSVTRYEL